ncbi:protein saal1 [Drosophila tropicalis]|uniref:protein saal1 n=1 Tax=Drosophila tropicalis TaxID=46794 RepID=UPI0035ABDB92
MPGPENHKGHNEAGGSEPDSPDTPSHDIQSNGDSDGNEEELLERMRGDAVGDTMYSRRFVLQTLMRLSQQDEGPLSQELEDALCKVWDMSVSRELVALLLENDAIGLLMYAITGSDDVRLYEILIGMLGNMCAQVECVEQLTMNPDWIETLLKLATCMDTGMLLQLMRVYQYIMTHVMSGKEKFAIDFYICFAAFEGSSRHLGFILQQSVSDELLSATLKAINAVLASCAMVEEENAGTDLNLKPFADVFLVQELCDGVNSAFMRLMRDDQAKQADEVNGDHGDLPPSNEDTDAEEDADVGYSACAPKISCEVEIIQTYLNICTILVQLPEAQDGCLMDVYAPNIMNCLNRILLFLQQPMQLLPMGERQEEYLEDLAHICSRLKYFYHRDAFVNLLKIWSRLRQHIEDYNESNTGDNSSGDGFDTDEEDDVPREQYVENAFKLLRLMAYMLVKADSVVDLQEIIKVDKIENFMSSLKAEQDVIFSKAHERLSESLDKDQGSGQA